MDFSVFDDYECEGQISLSEFMGDKQESKEDESDGNQR